MIKNEREYETTKAQLLRLEASLEKSGADLTARADMPEAVRQGHRNGIQMLIDDLLAELDAYEASHAHVAKAA